MAGITQFDQQTADIICRRLIEGESLITICKSPELPAESTIYKWLSEQPKFSEQYARARELQAETFLDRMAEIAHDGSDDWIMTKKGPVVDSECVNRSRLRVDTLKWQMSKLAPKKYGDRVTQELTGEVVQRVVVDI